MNSTPITPKQPFGINLPIDSENLEALLRDPARRQLYQFIDCRERYCGDSTSDSGTTLELSKSITECEEDLKDYGIMMSHSLPINSGKLSSFEFTDRNVFHQTNVEEFSLKNLDSNGILDSLSCLHLCRIPLSGKLVVKELLRKKALLPYRPTICLCDNGDQSEMVGNLLGKRVVNSLFYLSGTIKNRSKSC